MIIEPRNPAATADILRKPTRSWSTNADKSVSIRGPTKNIEIASAIGSLASDAKKNNVARAIKKPRVACTHSNFDVLRELVFRLK